MPEVLNPKEPLADKIVGVIQRADADFTMPEPLKLFTISEFRHELGIPLVLARKLIVWGLVKVVRTTDGTIQITEGELLETKEFLKSPWQRTKLFVRALGPGLITGASDDDPGGIATYSAVGAAFGYKMLWMALWLLPLMTAVQEACARIGIVTNKGLSGVLKKHYAKWVVFLVVLFLIVANVVNIGADLGAMAASLKLVWDVNFTAAAFGFALLILLIEVAIPYRYYASVLKWLTISIFAYVVTGFIIRPEWLSVFKEALVPDFILSKDYIFAIVAVFGTTITPYLFFWQASEEVEEGKMTPKSDEAGKPIAYRLTDRIAHMRTDVRTGMALANLVFFFIILTTAKVLHQNGITSIETAEQAAEALRPFAGDQAFLLFALGIIGTGLLAVPILAGSGAYALAELMGWREGLGKKFSEAKAFYMVIAISILVGLGLNFVGISPITALYYSAFLNGVIAVPLLFVIMIVGGDKKIMGRETHPNWVKFFGWAAFIFSAIAVLSIIIMQFIK
ncbi:MAG: divalent metal cation transporter [Patescibacteria group bacterium]